jgi:hypothetical protein
MDVRPFIVSSDGQRKTMIYTTVGDLVAALSSIAFEMCGENKRGYMLAGLALEAVVGRERAKRLIGAKL